MNNKELLNKVENECYDNLLKITNVRDFNKDVGEKELKAIHDNKASFKFMFAYVLNTIINSECPNSSYITFNHHFTLSYLMNFLRMSPFNSDDLSEHTFNTTIIDGDRFPYSFDEEPSIKRIDSELMYSFDIMLKIDFKYYADNRDFVLEQIKKRADVYSLVDNNKAISNNYFIVVPKGYKVDDPSKFTLDYAYNHKKEGEILFRIYPYNFSYSFFHMLKNKFGCLDLNECLNHYKYSHKYGCLPKNMINPDNRDIFKHKCHFLDDLFKECLVDYTLRDIQEHVKIKLFPPSYFIFFDDFYNIFVDLGYSSKESFKKCTNINRYLWSDEEDSAFSELNQLHEVINEDYYKDLKYKLKYRYYDDVMVEFYYEVQIALYEYKYRDEFIKLRKEYGESYHESMKVIEG